jgi:hypothetical protein
MHFGRNTKRKRTPREDKNPGKWEDGEKKVS